MKNRPSPLYEIGDVVFINCSRQGLNLGNTKFGTITKRKYRLGYSYLVTFRTKKASGKEICEVSHWFYEGAIEPKAEYAEDCLCRKIDALKSTRKIVKGHQLRIKIAQIEDNIRMYKTSIQEDRARINECKKELSKTRAKVKKLLGK